MSATATTAMRFGPVPMGVPMPPKSAANVTPSSSARWNDAAAGSARSSALPNRGRSVAIILAPAAMFDIHIDAPPRPP